MMDLLVAVVFLNWVGGLLYFIHFGVSMDIELSLGIKEIAITHVAAPFIPLLIAMYVAMGRGPLPSPKDIEESIKAERTWEPPHDADDGDTFHILSTKLLALPALTAIVAVVPMPSLDYTKLLAMTVFTGAALYITASYLIGAYCCVKLISALVRNRVIAPLAYLIPVVAVFASPWLLLWCTPLFPGPTFAPDTDWIADRWVRLFAHSITVVTALDEEDILGDFDKDIDSIDPG